MPMYPSKPSHESDTAKNRSDGPDTSSRYSCAKCGETSCDPTSMQITSPTPYIFSKAVYWKGVRGVYCRANKNPETIKTASALPALVFHENVGDRGETAITLPQLAISMLAPNFNQMGAIVVEAGVTEEVRKRFFDASSKPEDVRELFSTERQDPQDSAERLFPVKYRLSFHPWVPSAESSPRWGPASTAASTSSASQPEVTTPSGAALSENGDLVWSVPLPPGQVCAAFNALHDALEHVDIGDLLASRLNEKEAILCRAMGSLYKERDTEVQADFRRELATMSATTRFECLHDAIEEGISQTFGVPENRDRDQKRLTEVVSEACSEYARRAHDLGKAKKW